MSARNVRHCQAIAESSVRWQISFPPGCKGDDKGSVPETLSLVVQGSRVAPRRRLVQLS